MTSIKVEGYLFTETPFNSTNPQVRLTKVRGPLTSAVSVSGDKETQFQKDMTEENSDCSKVLAAVAPNLPEITEFPPVTQFVWFDFHGVVYAPGNEVKHFNYLLSEAIGLRKKGVGICVCSFVGRKTRAHSNLMAYFSSSLLQDIFVGIFAVYEKRRNSKAKHGKGFVINWFLRESALAGQTRTIFADDDPANVLDVEEWTDPYRCITVRVADPNTTDKGELPDAAKHSTTITKFDELMARVWALFASD